jgi:TolB-like protein/class 3 adenylate cyclase/Flp pilus assembly protein TadD
MSDDGRGHARRRLAAILFAGYSRLFPGDEAESFADVTLLLSEIIKPQVLKSGGNIIRWTGDGVLVEFESVVEAVRCGAALRDAVTRLNQTVLPERRIGIRIGINLDDVIAEDGDVFGDGVNIAARLEALAKPGSIYISEIVRDRVAGRVGFDFEDLGAYNLKNIARPVRIFRLGGEVAGQWAPLANGGAVAASPAAFENGRAIAVLPFANFGCDPEQEYFADGITEDIISMLAGWRAFPVIARDSTFTYKGKTVDIKKVGQELGVRYVVEGSVRKSGGRVRVTAQLIRADTGHHLMAERYDRDLTDSFALQDEIVTAIAGAIEPELLKFERDRIADRPQRSEDAYEFYQRGMWHHYRYNKTDNIAAQDYFRRALAIDPHYPQATAALSIAVRNAAYNPGWTENPEQNYEEAFGLAQRAVALDARYPNARFALGLACMYTHLPDRAMAELCQAIELNPSFAAAYAILGHQLTYAGRPEETIPLVEKGIRLSPTDPRLFIWLPALAAAHYQLGHYQQAVEAGRRSWTLNRNRPVGLRYAVAGLAQLGRIEEARAALTELSRFDENLASFERLARRLYKEGDPVDHLLDGLRKAGMK